MSEELKQKLAELVDGTFYDGHYCCNEDYCDAYADTEKLVAQIESAFKEAGYIKPQIALHVKTRLWTPRGYDDYTNTWTPQPIMPRNKLHIALEAQGESFVEIELTNQEASGVDK